MHEAKTKYLATLEQLVPSLLDALLRSPNTEQLKMLYDCLEKLQSEATSPQFTIYTDICEKLFNFGATQTQPETAAQAFGSFIRWLSPTTLLLQLQVLLRIVDDDYSEANQPRYDSAVNAASFALHCSLQPVTRTRTVIEHDHKLLALVIQTTNGLLNNRANEMGTDHCHSYLELSLQVIQQLTGNSDNDEPQYFKQIATWLPFAFDCNLQEQLFNAMRNCSAVKMPQFIAQQLQIARTDDDQKVVTRALQFCNFAGPIPIELTSEIARKFQDLESELSIILMSAHE